MKHLVVLSGGLDSAVTLYHTRKLYPDDELHVIRVDSGSRQSFKESQAFTLLADAVGIPEEHRYESELSMPWLENHDLYAAGTVAVEGNGAWGRASKEPINVQPTWVPARNLVFLSIAASCAVTVGANLIHVGFDWTPEHSAFSDKSPTFLYNLDGLLHGIVEAACPEVRAPLNRLSKSQIVKLGHELGVPFEKTWSCYNAFALPCGICAACRPRMQAFAACGLNDPLRYMPESVIDDSIASPFV
jgi:7-cyano-7-deazaguanine synthase